MKTITFKRKSRDNYTFALTEVNEIYANLEVTSRDPETGQGVWRNQEMMMALDWVELKTRFSYLTQGSVKKLAAFLREECPEEFKYQYRAY